MQRRAAADDAADADDDDDDAIDAGIAQWEGCSNLVYAVLEDLSQLLTISEFVTIVTELLHHDDPQVDVCSDDKHLLSAHSSRGVVCTCVPH